MKTFGALLLGFIFNLVAHAAVSFLLTPVHAFMTGSGLGGPIIAVVMAAAVVAYSGYLAAYLAARIVPGVSIKGYAVTMAVLVLIGTISWLSSESMFDQGLLAFLMVALGTLGAGIGAAIGLSAGLHDGG